MWNHVLEPATGEEDRRMWIRCPLGSDGGLCKARLPRNLLAKFLMESMSWLVGRTMKQLVAFFDEFQAWLLCSQDLLTPQPCKSLQ